MVKKVNIITLGCPKNVVDSEKLAKQLKANNLEVSFEDIADALVTNERQQVEKNKAVDYVIINTCGFINDAKQESIETILKYIEEKKKGKVKKVIVSGCLSKRYSEELKKELPEADGFFGTESYKEISKFLNINYDYRLLTQRESITASHFAYLKISEGCDRKCSFCAIPMIRGNYVSRPIEEILEEAKNLAERKVKEIIVIAEDTTLYGKDLYGKRRIAELLERLSEIDGIEWVRLQYSFPSGFPKDLLSVIKNNPKICKYIDIPFQHISDRVLKSMRRGITKERTYKLIEKIRSTVPGIGIRTSLITGYPEEKQKDFDELLEFVKTIEFDRLGVFTYSHEENTIAYKLKDSVPEKIKQERAGMIMKTQREISKKLNESKIGKVYKVLIDAKIGNKYVGRTEQDSPEIDNTIIIKGTIRNIEVGGFYKVRITEAKEYDLYGEIADLN